MPPRYRREFLLQRALHRCEYCHIPNNRISLSLQVDHIIAQQHGGNDDEENLAMACTHCNTSKGPNIASIDWQAHQIVPLFNPRKQSWPEHFKIDDEIVTGLTPSGRATVSLLDMNDNILVHLRRVIRLLGTPVGP